MKSDRLTRKNLFNQIQVLIRTDLMRFESNYGFESVVNYYTSSNT